MDWFLIWFVPRSVIPASTRMLMSQSLSIIASSLLCCLAFVSRCMLQHNSRICDWLCGLLWLVGIVLSLLVTGMVTTDFVLHFGVSKCCYSLVLFCCLLCMRLLERLLLLLLMAVDSYLADLACCLW